MKVEPSPGALFTVISPPRTLQNFLLIASPRPVPPNLRVEGPSPRTNGSKRTFDQLHIHANAAVRDRNFRDIPLIGSLECDVSDTWPSIVNLQALLRILIRT